MEWSIFKKSQNPGISGTQVVLFGFWMIWPPSPPKKLSKTHQNPMKLFGRAWNFDGLGKKREIVWLLNSVKQNEHLRCSIHSNSHIGSVYGISTYIYQRNQPNVRKYNIHGSYVIGLQSATSIPTYYQTKHQHINFQCSEQPTSPVND